MFAKNFVTFLALKLLHRYYSVIFCHKCGDFFSLEIIAYYSVIFAINFVTFSALKLLHAIFCHKCGDFFSPYVAHSKLRCSHLLSETVKNLTIETDCSGGQV